MQRLTDKLFLAVIILIFLENYSVPLTLFLGGLLTAIIFSGLTYIFENLYMKYITCIIYIVLCSFFPMFFYFTPIVFHEIFYNRNLKCHPSKTEKKLQYSIKIYLSTYKITIPYLYIVLCNIAYIIAAAALIISLNFLFCNEVFYVALYNCISAYLAYNTFKINIAEQKNIVLMDNATENKLLLEEKNRVLISQQSSQIYAATLKERNRIAREIHDNVGHMITRSILQLGAIKTINKDNNIKPLLQQLQKTLDESMNNIRNSVHDLHDEAVDLKLAIYEIAKNVDKFEFYIDYSMQENIPKNIKYNFISILKEGITNAEKYSNGDKISIIAREHPAFYQLIIKDNGKLYDGENSKFVLSSIDSIDGIGLKNIKERVEALGGTLKITYNDGFKIFVTIMKEKKYD